jgi:hypothetical protein
VNPEFIQAVRAEALAFVTKDRARVSKCNELAKVVETAKLPTRLFRKKQSGAATEKVLNREAAVTRLQQAFPEFCKDEIKAAISEQIKLLCFSDQNFGETHQLDFVHPTRHNRKLRSTRIGN